MAWLLPLPSRRTHVALLVVCAVAALLFAWVLLPQALLAARAARRAAARALQRPAGGGESWERAAWAAEDAPPPGAEDGARESVLLHASPPTRWTWACVAAKGRCEKQPLAPPPSTAPAQTGAGVGVTLLTCQMTCGDPPLWPRPTGNSTVGSGSLPIAPRAIVFTADGGGWSERERRLLLAAGERVRAKAVALQPPFAPRGQRTPVAPHPLRVSFHRLRDPAEEGEEVAVEGEEAEAEGRLRLTLLTDEGYTLRVWRVEAEAPAEARVEAHVEARTYYGARHALETLLQLMWWDGACLRVLSSAWMSDAPRFPYRGLMLDTARTFFPMASLRATVDAMAAVKMNVFHWHISDSHSFPWASRSVPQMAADGAYDAHAVYTAEDVSGLEAYARVRGVRLLVEMDAPAHAGNGWRWTERAGMGAVALCVNHPKWKMMCGQPPCGQLNPDNPFTYVVLGRLYKELVELTRPSDLFHMGGDEVSSQCWQQSLPNITSQEDFLERWRTFEYRALQQLQEAWPALNPLTVSAERRRKRKTRQRRRASAKGAGQRDGAGGGVRGGAGGGAGWRPGASAAAVVWSSALTGDEMLDPEKFVVQVWGPSSWGEASKLIKAKYRVILSHVDAWYFDCGLGDYRTLGDSPCNNYHTWQHVYQHAPWWNRRSYPPSTTAPAATSWPTAPGARAAPEGVLGGEACLWTERTDAQVLDSRLWPRGAALAERLWTDPPTGDDDDPWPEDADAPDGPDDHRRYYASPPPSGASWMRAHPRLALQRERLVAWGVRADAVQPTWCAQNPWRCY